MKLSNSLSSIYNRAILTKKFPESFQKFYEPEIKIKSIVKSRSSRNNTIDSKTEL